MKKVKYFIIGLILLFGISLASACEFGTTKKDFYGQPTEHEKNICSYFPSKAFYINPTDENKKYFYGLDISDEPKFEDGIINIQTEYSLDWYRRLPKEDMPFVLYKSHRWYPQHHGVIYVYKDGSEHE